MQILGLLGMYFDAVVVEVKTFLLLFRLALAILCRTYFFPLGEVNTSFSNLVTRGNNYRKVLCDFF